MFFSKVLQNIKTINSNASKNPSYFYYKVIQNKNIPSLKNVKNMKLRLLPPRMNNIKENIKKNNSLIALSDNNNLEQIHKTNKINKITKITKITKIKKPSLNYIILSSGLIMITTIYGYILFTNIIVL